MLEQSTSGSSFTKRNHHQTSVTMMRSLILVFGLSLHCLMTMAPMTNSFVIHTQPSVPTNHLPLQTSRLSRSAYLKNGRCTARLSMSSDEEMMDDRPNAEAVNDLTISQLKQQLRLRGLKVSGKKQDLINRLLGKIAGDAVVEELMPPAAASSRTSTTPMESTTMEENLEADLLSELQSKDIKPPTMTDAQSKAKAKGKEFIDVEAYLEEDDKGMHAKSSVPLTPPETPVDEENPVSDDPEVWGADAKIVDDLEYENPVVDVLSRTIVEFKGSNQTMVQAYVVASRDALKPFLAGGKNRTGDPEDRLREIQVKREKAAKRIVRKDDENQGLDEGDEDGIFDSILYRDFSDWGKYSVTGAQISAQEVQGVLFLSDVYGAFHADTRALADKIAFECQPVVVMVPDLFRENPWKEDPTTPGFNEEGEDYETWRAQHGDVRVSVDIRAAAATLRDQYGVSSVVVWGTCFGGGRALEAAAGHLPNGQISDVDGVIGPPLVKPEVAIVWYPTRYDVDSLFGPKKSVYGQGGQSPFAVMAVFGGDDALDGATKDDAEKLNKLLEADTQVKDHMVKIFPSQGHGFAHNGIGTIKEDPSEYDRFVDDEFGGASSRSSANGDAEVACLLSTAFMETYSRMFLPTVGRPISQDESSKEWRENLEMQDLSQTTARDVRGEIESDMQNFKEDLTGGINVDSDDEEEMARILKGMQADDAPEEYRIQDDDEIEDIYAKLMAGDDSFQLR